MKIACLGWGSLIWRPENLLIRREWFQDGPFLPIEFTRQSANGRLTLVINKDAKPIRTLWSLMAIDNLNAAKESLRIREGIGEKNAERYIGSVTKKNEENNDEIKLTIQQWAEQLDIDAVIWTRLPSRFKNRDGEAPTIEEAISYLQSLDLNSRAVAEEYVRKAPKQIETEYRRRFEMEFGWGDAEN